MAYQLCNAAKGYLDSNSRKVLCGALPRYSPCCTLIGELNVTVRQRYPKILYLQIQLTKE